MKQGHPFEWFIKIRSGSYFLKEYGVLFFVDILHNSVLKFQRAEKHRAEFPFISPTYGRLPRPMNLWRTKEETVGAFFHIQLWYLYTLYLLLEQKLLGWTESLAVPNLAENFFLSLLG